jgi:hypothetical protein
MHTAPSRAHAAINIRGNDKSPAATVGSLDVIFDFFIKKASEAFYY